VGGNPKSPAFDGILLQEWDAKAKKLVGPIKNIYPGTDLGLVEGPHLFKRGEYYYLTTAEGGTGYNHAVTMARSKTIDGVYETHPNKHLITSRFSPEATLQRAGHGQMVEMADGKVYHTHLCGRPLQTSKGPRCPLGRETALQLCVWKDDGWLYLAQGGQTPAVEVEAAATRLPRGPVRHNFKGMTQLPIEFQWLRTPYPERLFTLTGDALRVTGRESLGSWYEQSLVARRQEDFNFRAETRVRFDPDTYQQAAGLTHYYNRHKLHYLAVTLDEKLGRVLTIMSCNGDYPDNRLTWPVKVPVQVPEDVGLAAEVKGEYLQFYYDIGQGWTAIGPVLDAGVISDEGGRGEHGSFTGAFIGMLAFDTSGRARTADFSHFDYIPG
jgi:xylan 1,4-beta-xylosidase